MHIIMMDTYNGTLGFPKGKSLLFNGMYRYLYGSVTFDNVFRSQQIQQTHPPSIQCPHINGSLYMAAERNLRTAAIVCSLLQIHVIPNRIYPVFLPLWEP